MSNTLYRKFHIPSDHHEKIVAHPLNKAIITCYLACLDHDFVRAKEIKNQFACSSSVRNIYTILFERYQQKTFDQYGLYLFGEHDPFIKNMPIHKKQYLSSAEQDTFNQLISLRKSIKNNLQTTWNIPDTAPQIVHDTLYAFIPTQTITLPKPLYLLKTATELTQDYSINHHDTLMQALYTRNGIFKDFIQYRYATIQLPKHINNKSYAATRESLNKTLYFSQITPDVATTTLAQQALSYLQAHFAATDPLEAQCYLTLHHALCNALEGHGDQLVVTLPDLVAPTSYTVEQLDIHRALLATTCIALDLHCPELAWTSPNTDHIHQEAEIWIQLITTAHGLTKQGDTQKALILLEDYFIKPYQLQNDIPADNNPQKPAPSSKPNTNKQNNNNDKEPALAQGAKLLTPALALKEQIQEAEAYFAQRLVECADKIARLQKETCFTIQKFDFNHLLDMVTSRGQLKGYHTEIIYNHVQEFIIHPQPDRCYRIIASMRNSADRLIKDYKSMFPTNWDMCKIIDVFFEAVEKYNKITPSKNNTRFAVESIIDKQWYRIIIDLPGYVVTFYPFF